MDTSDDALAGAELPSGTAGSLPVRARSLRRRNRLTLDEIARAARLSKGHLSRFERGEKSLSIAALVRLAKALDTSVASLLGEQVDEDLLHVTRAEERPRRITSRAEGSYEFVPLTRTDEHPGPSAFIVHLNADSSVGSERVSHEGDELFFVLSGSVEIVLASRSIFLGQGDFAQFPGLIQHRVRGLEPKTSLLVFIADDRP